MVVDYILSPLIVNGHFLPLLCNRSSSPSAKAEETQLVPSGRWVIPGSPAVTNSRTRPGVTVLSTELGLSQQHPQEEYRC